MKQTFLLLLPLMIFGVVGCQSGNREEEKTVEKTEALPDNTLEELNSQIAKDGDNDMLYIRRADYYLSENKVDSALRDIIFAIDIDPENTNHYITLSDAYLAMGNPDKCLEALERALALDETNQEALMKKAQLYLIMRDYDQTYQTITELISIDRINPIAYFVRAMALIEQNDTANAIKNLQVAVDQKQDYFEAQLQLGILYANQRNPLAVSYLQNAINLEPMVIEPYYQLGLFFQENDRIESAIQTYNSILDVDPEYVPALYNLGYIKLVYQQDFPRAADYFSQVVQLAPDYAEAWYNRGYSYELMGQEKLARSDYKETLELKENYPKAIEALNRLDK